MIDLHLHVLPGIDDGSSSAEMSASMLDHLAGMGMSRIVATPHLMDPLTDEYHQLAQALLDDVRSTAATHGITVDFGYEHLLAPGLAARLTAGEPSTLAGSTAVLVELPFIGWPRHTETSLFSLRMAGYVPVLAHPERYVEVQKDPELAIATGERGAVLQLTSGSFAGVYGKQVERSARRLLDLAIERDVAIVLASDAHSDGQRLVRVTDGLRWIDTHVDEGRGIVEWATRIVPDRLLDSQAVPSYTRWREMVPPERRDRRAGASGSPGNSPWRRLVARIMGDQTA
jgi:protein-tyrosine phosphatase